MKTQRKPYEFTDRKATFQESENENNRRILDLNRKSKGYVGNTELEAFNSDKKDWEQFFNLKSK